MLTPKITAPTIVFALLLAGCSFANHQRYTWTGAACPGSFAQDHAMCFRDIGYVPILFGAGPGIVNKRYRDCMKARGYQQIGDETHMREQRTRLIWGWQRGDWPWPESPPASAWMWRERAWAGVDYVDAVCVLPGPVSK